MRLSLTGLAALGALALVPAGLSAQEICGGTLTTPAAGSYAEYRVTQGDHGSQQVRFAIVGTQDQSAARNVWFENRVRAEGKVPVVSQVLVPGFPYKPSALAAATLQSDTLPPLRFNAQQLARARQGQLPGLLQSIVDGCRSSTLVGTETVNAAGRSIRARHYRNALRGSDIWVSSEVPFGIVKLTDGTDHTTVELTATGTGAKSSLKGSRGRNGS